MFENKYALEWLSPEDEKTVIDLACVVGARAEGNYTVVMLRSGHSVQLQMRYEEFTQLLADRNWEIASGVEE